MIETIELKLTYLLLFLFLGQGMVTFLIVMRTIGQINHALTRIQTLLSKELVLTYNRNVNHLKQSRKRTEQSEERTKRQEAILNIPLIVKKNRAQQERDSREDLK
jgi:dethiobiotin synthetase